MENRDQVLAQKIREKCIQAAREGFRDASISGLCAEGAMEAAISGMQKIDLTKMLNEIQNES